MRRDVLIVGGGRVGRHVAERLSEDRNAVTVVERDAEKCERVSPTVNRVVEGDGTDPAVLERAGLTETDVVAALTNDPEVNLDICETVGEREPDVRTVLRIARDGQRDYGHLGFVDDVVYPADAAADVAADRITRR